MEFKIDQDKLLEMAADTIVDQYCDNERIGEMVEAKITGRINKLFADGLSDKIEALLEKELQACLDATIQPVDIFGDKIGTPTTIRTELHNRARNFWETKVDASGKPAKRDSWSTREDKTRAEWMIGKMVSDEFAAQVRANTTTIAEALKEAMRKDAHAMIDKHIEGLIKTGRR